jgi:hypothetical protein
VICISFRDGFCCSVRLYPSIRPIASLSFILSRSTIVELIAMIDVQPAHTDLAIYHEKLCTHVRGLRAELGARSITRPRSGFTSAGFTLLDTRSPRRLSAASARLHFVFHSFLLRCCASVIGVRAFSAAVDRRHSVVIGLAAREPSVGIFDGRCNAGAERVRA